MAWNLLKTTQGYETIALAEGVSGAIQMSIVSGWVFLNGRDIVLPAAGVVAVLPAEARPVYNPLYGLLGRTGSGQLAHFTLSTSGGDLTLRSASSQLGPLYFTLSWPQAVRRGF